jgi:hypothetical protein
MGAGVDTKSDPKVLNIGKLLVCENARFTKIGTNNKRPGYRNLGNEVLDLTELPEGKRLATFRDELLLLSQDRCYSYVEATNRWADRGLMAAVGVRSKQLVRNTASQAQPNVATCRGVTVYAWEDSRGGVRVSVIDQESGLPILGDTEISATGVKPKVTATRDYIYVHYLEGSNFLCRRLSPLTPTTFAAAITLAGDVKASPNNHFDICRHGLNMVFAYEQTSDTVVIGYLDQTGDIGGALDGFPTAVNSAGAGEYSLAIHSRFEGDSDDGIYVAYHNSTAGLTVEIYNLDLTLDSTTVVTATTTQVHNIGLLVDGDQAQLWWEVNASATYNRFIRSSVITRAGVATAVTVFLRSVGLVSKPWKGPDDNYYMVCAHESTYQSGYFTVRSISQSRAFVVNTIASENGGGLTTKNTSLANVAQYSDDVYLFPARVKTRLQTDSGALYSQVGLQACTFDFADGRLFETEEIGRNLHIAGGVLMAYDGVSVFEHGFNLWPENLSVATSAGTGSNTAGAKQYVAVYEWTDAQGQVHQSAPSIPLDVTSVANDRHTITVPTLRITEKKSAASRTDVSVVLYKTKVGGRIFYRVSSISSPTLNDTTADTVAIVDDSADASIGANQLLYTNGSVLENLQPGSATVIAKFRNRLILAGLEDDNVVEYSKRYVKGEPANFADQQFRHDQGSGGVTGLIEMDEKLLLFKATSIHRQVGEGPTDTGAQNDYLDPIEVAGDVGTAYPQSIVKMPLGVMFKSAKGFYLIDRALQTSYIGAPVEDFNDLTVTGAALIPDANEVRFTHSDGSILVYEYFTQQWSVDTVRDCLSCTLWQNQFVVLKDTGRIMIENPSSHMDAGTEVRMRLKTPWIRAGALQGAQRIYKALILGEYHSQHLLRIKVRYDYNDSVAEQFIFDPETILGSEYYGEASYYGYSPYYGGNVDPIYQVEIQPAQQQCQAIQFEIEDLNPESVDGAGFSITGITLEVGIDGKAHRLRPEKKLTAS